MNSPHLTLSDVTLPAPCPAIVAVLVVLGFAWVGNVVACRLRGPTATRLDRAAGFLLVTMCVAAVVHGLALAGGLAPVVLRGIGIVAAVAGGRAVYELVRHRRWLMQRRRADWRAASTLGRATQAMTATLLGGYLLLALTPATDIDSLHYHLGVPLDWFAHGAAYPRAEWLHQRLVGLGEMIGLLGLACGTDCLSAVFQFAGLVAATLAARDLARSADGRALAGLFMVVTPVLLYLVPNQKPQLLPAAALAVGMALALRRWRRFDGATAVLAGSAVALAVACKHSFLLSGSLTLAMILAAAAQSGRFLRTAVVLGAVFAVVVGPLYVRNWIYYGDPLSPLLARWFDPGDSTNTTFALYLRNFSGEHSLSDIVRFTAALVVRNPLRSLPNMLGLGCLAFGLLAVSRSVPPLLVTATLVAGLLGVTLGQLTARFFVEHYFWLGLGVALLPNGWGRTALNVVLLGQGLVVLAAVAFGLYFLLPGAVLPSGQETVRQNFATDYRLEAWIDGHVPAEARIASNSTSAVWLPRPFYAFDSLRFLWFQPMSVSQRQAVAGQRLQQAGVEYAALTYQPNVPSRDVLLLAPYLGELVAGPIELPDTGRNPFRRHAARAAILVRLDYHARQSLPPGRWLDEQLAARERSETGE